ncbi:hypothetical protein Tco_1191505 [Tanacetum coccineum]
MPPKRTSTSETPTITLAVIQQLITDGISSALKAQAAIMASASNPNMKKDIMQIGAQKQTTGPQEGVLRDKFTFVHSRISTLETTLKDIQVHH